MKMQDWPSMQDAPLADALQRIQALEVQLQQSQHENLEARTAAENYKQDADNAKAAAAEAYQSMEQAFAANEATAARARLLEQELARLKGTPSPAQSLSSSDMGGSTTSSQIAGNPLGSSSGNGGSNGSGSGSNNPHSHHNPWNLSSSDDGDKTDMGKLQVIP